MLQGEVNDKRFRPVWPHPEITSSISIPMQVANKVVGTLNINALNRPRPFTLAQQKVLMILASTAAAALESASLHTQVMRAEQNYRLEEQLRHSQKMEAIGQLAGGVAHDFNNLLTAINGYSSLALQRANPDSRTKTYLEEIKKAGDRAANLTRQLLAFGRKQMLKPVALNLNEVVFDMNKMLRRLIGEDIKFDAKLDPQLKKIKADPGQIEQVLVNLVVNSRDAMPQGGALTIETANFEVDQQYTGKLLALPPGGYVMLAVSDTGCGMSIETKARIFEPFFTTKDKGRGTGLGLSTVYGIVKQSGGNIWVYSEPNRGTTVKVYLPQFDCDKEQAERPGVEKAAPRGSETILLVEDEDVVRGLARQILQQAGYNVLDAGSGDEALRMCREHSDPIHLLLTDVVMPETSGKEIAQSLTSLRPGTCVLFMSGYTDDAIVHHGVLDSNVEFIQKPFTPVALARKVREVLDLNCGEQCKKLSLGGLQDDCK
jgi:two-component system, cell cycle sensor histidine kinase and response regulator CckA